nr:flavonoid hydroxylase 3 [Dracocephalum moldavica]
MEIIAVTVVSFLVFVYAVVKLVRCGNESSQNEIPGPKKLPVIGNLHLLAGGSLPHRVFRDLAAKYGPLMRLQLGQIPFLIVSSVEVAKQVVRSHDVVFANRIPMLAAITISYNYHDIVVAPYGEHWRQLRRICTLELLSSRRVKSFRAIREEENSKLAHLIASNAGLPANVSESVQKSAFEIITRSAVGSQAPDKAAKFTWAIQETVKLGSGLCIADLFPSNKLLPTISGMNYKIAKIFRVTDDILQSIIDRHRAATANDDVMMESGSEDLVDVLLKYQQDDSLQVQITTETIKAVILDILIGGSDTSATTVGWAMSEMIRNPITLKRAQEEVRQVLDDKGYVDEEKFAEMKYFNLVIKETLRLHPPLPLLMPRMSSEGCEIKGYKIAGGSRVMINAWALGRDPTYWDEAEKFKPERFEKSSSIDFKGNNLEYIPFGSGRRICPGISMGVVNVEFTLATLLYHFDWEMPHGIKNEDLDMTEAFGAFVKRKYDLLLIPTLRRPLSHLQ